MPKKLHLLIESTVVYKNETEIEKLRNIILLRLNLRDFNIFGFL